MGDEAPERLFYATMLREVFQGLADASRGRGIVDGLDPGVFATAPEMVAVSFDASPYLEQKFFALTAHRSAFGVTPEMLKNPPPSAAPMLQAFRPVWAGNVPPQVRAVFGVAAGIFSTIRHRTHSMVDRVRYRAPLHKSSLRSARRHLSGPDRSQMGISNE
jgi:hypothetical protein